MMCESTRTGPTKHNQPANQPNVQPANRNKQNAKEEEVVAIYIYNRENSQPDWKT